MLLCHYIATNTVEATGSLQGHLAKVQQASLVLCCLDDEKVVIHLFLASSGCKLGAHYKIAESALWLEAVQDETS